MEKDFDRWNEIKKRLARDAPLPPAFPKDGEVWMCSLGKNLGREQDDGSQDFSRPVLIVKKFNNEIFLVVPLSSKQKPLDFYFNYNDCSALVPNLVGRRPEISGEVDGSAGMIELILAAVLAFSVAHPEVELEITIEVDAAISDHSVSRSCRRNGRWARDVPRALAGLGPPPPRCRGHGEGGPAHGRGEPIAGQ
jgi:PemK-like, MazF-like toxin of type II toxin-antitoxin system